MFSIIFTSFIVLFLELVIIIRIQLPLLKAKFTPQKFKVYHSKLFKQVNSK